MKKINTIYNSIFFQLKIKKHLIIGLYLLQNNISPIEILSRKMNFECNSSRNGISK